MHQSVALITSQRKCALSLSVVHEARVLVHILGDTKMLCDMVDGMLWCPPQQWEGTWMKDIYETGAHTRSTTPPRQSETLLGFCRYCSETQHQARIMKNITQLSTAIHTDNHKKCAHKNNPELDITCNLWKDTSVVTNLLCDFRQTENQKKIQRKKKMKSHGVQKLVPE